VIATFHAGSAVEALTRLLEMGLEPYLVRSALNLVSVSDCCGGVATAGIREREYLLPGRFLQTNL